MIYSNPLKTILVVPGYKPLQTTINFQLTSHQRQQWILQTPTKPVLTNAFANLPVLFGHIFNHHTRGNGVWEFEAIGCHPLFGSPFGPTLGCSCPLRATLGCCCLAGSHGGPLTGCCWLWNGRWGSSPLTVPGLSHLFSVQSEERIENNINDNFLYTEFFPVQIQEIQPLIDYKVSVNFLYNS